MEERNLEYKIIEKLVLETIKEQRSSRRWKIFFRLCWLIIIGAILFAFFSGKSNSIVKTGKQVAVVNLSGIIDDDNKSYVNLRDGVLAALKDQNTVAVIIRANSPGGSPVYSQMAYDEILRLRKLYPKKPIDVVVEEVCASGCYYIASGADKIYASPASIVGSIGVIYSGFGLTGLIDKIGVDSRLLIAGKNKAMGYPFIPANAEQNAMQQQILDEIHTQFITAVQNGRGKRLHADPDLFSGRYWIGEDALTLGLVDGFATVDSLARDQYKTDNVVDFTPDQDPVDRVAKKLGVGMANSAKNALVTASFGGFN